MNAKEVLGFAKSKNIEMVDLKFMDFVGTWQHFAVPIYELKEDSFEEGFGFDGSSIRGWQPIHASDMLVIPDPETAVIDPFIARADAVADLQHRRPDHQGELHPRPPQHRAEGRVVPEVDRHRRHGVLRAGGRVLHLRRHPLRRGVELRLLLHRLRRGDLEHRARGEAEPRLQAASQGGVLPRSARRLAARPARRDGPRHGAGGAEDRGAAPRGGHRRTGRDRPPVRHAGEGRRRAAVVQVHLQERRAGRPERPSPSCRSRSSPTTAPGCTRTSPSGRAASRSSPGRSTAGCRRWRCGTSAGS